MFVTAWAEARGPTHGMSEILDHGKALLATSIRDTRQTWNILSTCTSVRSLKTGDAAASTTVVYLSPHQLHTTPDCVRGLDALDVVIPGLGW